MQRQMHISDSLKGKSIEELTEEDLDKIITPEHKESIRKIKGTPRHLIKISGKKVLIIFLVKIIF